MLSLGKNVEKSHTLICSTPEFCTTTSYPGSKFFARVNEIGADKKQFLPKWKNDKNHAQL